MSAFPILHVEDSPEDVFLLEYAFKRAEIANPVRVVTDGQMALDYLAGVGKFADRAEYPLPCLMLLDLKLPLVMGLEVLERMRRESPLRQIIVIVMSASVNESDIVRAYDLGANGFLVKPSDNNLLADMCKALKHFWLMHNRPPERCFVDE
jgi:CheY-like chemotaxis protein